MINSKEIILNAVQELPDNAGFEEAIEKLYLMSKIKKGITQADQGQTISHEEALQKFSKWLT
jgi:predicted transcriptional regulator